MIDTFATSGAEAPVNRRDLVRCAEACATQKLHTAVESHPSTGSGQALSQKTRKMGQPAVGHPAIILCALALLGSASGQGQGPATGGAPAATTAPTNSPQTTDSRPKADVIFMHGNVYTGVPANTGFSSILREEAIAVRGDRIQAVGKNLDILKLKGPQTQVIDLGGRFVMPGFNDAHVHLADAGLQRLSVDLTGVKTLDEFRARVQAKVETAKPGEWILGGGWDETMWPIPNLPSRWDLDQVSDGHPVFLDRVDGHLAVANTRALQLASITLASRDPRGREDRSRCQRAADGDSARDRAAGGAGGDSAADARRPAARELRLRWRTWPSTA